MSYLRDTIHPLIGHIIINHFIVVSQEYITGNQIDDRPDVGSLFTTGVVHFIYFIYIYIYIYIFSRRDGEDTFVIDQRSWVHHGSTLGCYFRIEIPDEAGTVPT